LHLCYITPININWTFLTGLLDLRSFQEVGQSRTGIVYYDDKLDQRHRLQEYVLSHIDEALEKGWIQVYFQPVIRTLTDKVCNLEALSRWIDPPGPAQLGQLLYQVLDHAKPRGDGLCPG
jgi:hypothetical protein